MEGRRRSSTRRGRRGRARRTGRARFPRLGRSAFRCRSRMCSLVFAIVRWSPYMDSSMLVKHSAGVEKPDPMQVLQALADPVRVEIVRQLAGCPGDGELTCGAVSLPVTKSTASHHFRTLLDAGVIAERSQGTRKYLHLR